MDNILFKAAIKFLFPFMVVFAFYIQLNGELSPGGGFQAGAIAATALIGYDLAFNSNKKLFDLNILKIFAVLGVFIYSFTGFLGMIFGDVFLNYSTLSIDEISGQKLGILVIELGVGTSVTAVLTLIYLSFKNRM